VGESGSSPKGATLAKRDSALLAAAAAASARASSRQHSGRESSVTARAPAAGAHCADKSFVHHDVVELKRLSMGKAPRSRARPSSGRVHRPVSSHAAASSASARNRFEGTAARARAAPRAAILTTD